MTFETVFRIEGNSVQRYIKIQSKGLKSIIIPNNVMQEVQTDELFTDKLEAMYTNFSRQINEGKKIKNFKRSKYFKKYLEIAKERNPEFLLL